MSINRSKQLTLPPLLSTFRPEMQLLICCARVEMTEPFRAHIDSLVANGISWDALLPLAARHGMIALLHRHLVTSKQFTLPTEFATLLNKQHKGSRAHQLFLKAQVLKVSRLLNQRKIPHLHYKGTVLDQLLYGGEMLRLSGDIDILIKKEDLFQIRDLLMAEGYQPKLIESDRQEETLLKQYKDYAFVHPQHKYVVEVHWSLMPSKFGNDFDYDYFDGCQQVMTIHQQSLITFGPEDTFLALACHGARHRFELLKWLVDLQQFINHYPDTDWPAVARRAKQENIETMFLLSVDLCQRLMGTTFNGYDVSVSRLRRIETLSKEACEVISSGRNQARPFEDILFHVRLVDGFGRKLRYILMISFSPNIKDVASTNLPWYLTPFYYVMRAVRVIRRRGIGLLLRSFGQMVRAVRE